MTTLNGLGRQPHPHDLFLVMFIFLTVLSPSPIATALTQAPLSSSAPSAMTAPQITSISPTVVARDESLAIVGHALLTVTTVLVDGVPSPFVLDPAGHLEVPTPPLYDSTAVPKGGRVTRTLVVHAGSHHSNSRSFEQLTSWAIVTAWPVFLAIAIYIAFLTRLLLADGSCVLRSRTTQWSLSKIQMALWTFLFGLSYLVLAIARREFLAISDGMFWLMGISSATAVGAAVSAAKAPPPATPSTLLADFNPGTGNYELSLHRCQVATWTVIVASMYVWQVYTTMALPDIPGNLLILMGISGGTYLGFR